MADIILISTRADCMVRELRLGGIARRFVQWRLADWISRQDTVWLAPWISPLSPPSSSTCPSRYGGMAVCLDLHL